MKNDVILISFFLFLVFFMVWRGARMNPVDEYSGNIGNLATLNFIICICYLYNKPPIIIFLL